MFKYVCLKKLGTIMIARKIQNPINWCVFDPTSKKIFFAAKTKVGPNTVF